MTHDPGGKVRLKLPPGVKGWATFSHCHRHRYALGRQIGAGGPFALFCGMNPSTAEDDIDDPTIRREWLFAKRWGFSRYIKVNIGSYRATNPRDLPAAPDEACPPENIETIRALAAGAGVVVMAHGVLPRPLIVPGERITSALIADGHKLFCLGKTKSSNSPRHPLYIRSDQPLEPYP